MRTLNRLIKFLYDELNTPIVPSDNLNAKLDSDYITYKYISNNTRDLESEKYLYEKNGEMYRAIHQQYQATVSFIAVSKDDIEAYELARSIKDLLDYSLAEDIYNELNITIIDTTAIKDVTVRLIDTNEYRFNIDLTFRHSREVERKVGKIETYNIEMKGMIEDD